jgi:hypothetical protein
MHSWVGFELVQVFIAFGLSPQLRDDLNDFSPDLFNLFSYFGEKQRDSSKKDEAERLLEILFNKTEHNSYFGKQPFGKKTKFLKMENTTIPLVILTWLRQLQEHFYLQPTLNKSNDWSDHGRYCNATQKLAVKKGVNNIYMAKAAGGQLHKMTSFDDIKPNNKDSDVVIKSLYDWSVRISHRDVPYVKDITNSIKRKKKQNKVIELQSMKSYTMKDEDFVSKEEDDHINIGVTRVTPKQQEHKTEAQLMENVCKFMTNEIAKIAKKTSDSAKVSQKDIDLHNSANLAAACLVQYVNIKSVQGPSFTSLDHLNQHMAEHAATKNIEEQEVNSSEEEYTDD